MALNRFLGILSPVVRSRNVLGSYSWLTVLRRPSGRQRPHRFSSKPCMAQGKGPREHPPRKFSD